MYAGSRRASSANNVADRSAGCGGADSAGSTKPISVAEGPCPTFSTKAAVRQTGVDRCPLDLLQLDPKAAELDLAVAPPEQLQRPARQLANQVSGAVHRSGRMTVDRRLWHELLRGELRTVQVAECNPRTADAQLSRLARPDRAEVLVEHVQPRVLQRVADRDALAAGKTVEPCTRT